MTPLAALLLLALGTETNAETHYPGASTVFHCTFESSHDEETSDWPPGWTRRHGPGFPRFVRVRVDDNRPPPGGRSLRVELDGGAATAYGPAIAVNSDLRYVLESYLQTSGLRHDAAYLSLIFLDSARTKLGGISSEKIGGSSVWRKMRLGPVSPPAGASSMIIELHVEPQGEMQDLRGTASFGALWLGQLPRVVLTAQPAVEISPQPASAVRNLADGRRVPRHSAEDADILALFPGPTDRNRVRRFRLRGPSS